jgi:hypothetical protein
MIHKDYYDYADKNTLMAEYRRGPQRAVVGVHPNATDAERDAIGKKRFDDKFNRNDMCPMGYYPEGYVNRPTIADRLKKTIDQNRNARYA